MTKVQIGEVYMDEVTKQQIIHPNRTRKYLLPCLKEYGSEFTNKLSNVFKVAAGIGDIITDNCGFTHEKHIFILLDSTKATRFFVEFLTWIRNQAMYEDDYIHGNIQKSIYHMVVLRFPEKYWDSFETFKKGDYSKMYDQKTIDSFFETYPDVKKVFVKDHDYRIVFTERVNKKYGTSLEAEEWEGELDFKPHDKQEKFNHHLKKK